MGSGKSTAAINYMNDHPDQRFIYITPYLEEAQRIKDGCPNLHFVAPSNKIPDFNFSKRNHAFELIKEGHNITSTHQLFRMCTREMLDAIQFQGYTLIIDEDLNLLNNEHVHPDDIIAATKCGVLAEAEPNKYTLTGADYKGNLFKPLYTIFGECSSGELVDKETDVNSGSVFYWSLPTSLITSFRDVFVLTYMFKGQDLHHFLEMNKLEYQYIGIDKDDRGRFQFSEDSSYTPEYVYHIGEKIHILNEQRMNQIGKDKHALSMSWYANNKDGTNQVKNNMYTYMRRRFKDRPAKDKLWGGFKELKAKIGGQGYAGGFTPFNTRATNEYRNRHTLAYPVNLYTNVAEKCYYRKHGVEIDDDDYALSTMIQWIWRSAIRDGEDVDIYIPSKRMRDLLTGWMDKIAKEGNKIYE